MTEMARALREGGRLGLAVWSSIDRCPPFHLMAAAIQDVLGEEPAARYRGGPWGLSDPVGLAALVEAAAFTDVTVAEVTRPVRFERGAQQLELSLAASSVWDDMVALATNARRALSAAIAARLDPLTDADGAIRSELTSQVVLAAA